MTPLARYLFRKLLPRADRGALTCLDILESQFGHARTRRERAEMLRREKRDFFDKYGPAARQVLTDILDKYIEYGTAQFQIPEILKVPPISERGTVSDIAAMFGGASQLRAAIDEMQTLLYAA